MLVVLLLMAQPSASAPPVDLAGLMQAYRNRTRVAVACLAPADPEEVVVCARREADGERLPFETVSLDSPDNVPERTRRALKDGGYRCGVTGPFFIGCAGMFGFGGRIGADGQVGRVRPLSP